MKTTRFLILTLFMLAANAAYANEFDVNCNYSHTFPDDPILFPGQPGRAMVHDFFGNSNTNAYSTYDSLNGNKATTCDTNADRSAYWLPQLKRPSGIVVPQFQKTYYKNDQPVVPLQPIPAGLELLAGDHMGTAPNPHINFLCRGGGYTTVAPTNCPVVTDGGGTYSQLDISVHFPDCWDGKTLVPNPMAGIANMAYRNSDGKCPSAYPVKIPELQMNVQYNLGQDPDLSSAQLSMDPKLMNGQWVAQWGSLYTSHGDFISAWKKDTMQYLIDTCSNKEALAGSACGKNIPTYYSATSADVWLDAQGVAHPADTPLVSAPGNVVLVKFPTPAGLGDYPYANSYLQTLGQNVTDSSAIMLALYAATTNWNDTTSLPTAAACTNQYIGGIYLNNASQVRLNDVTGYIKSQIDAGASQIGICIVNTTTETVQFSSREGSWAPGLFLK